MIPFGGVGVDIPQTNLKHMQLCVQFFSIIGLRKFEKLELSYLKNVSIELRENFATAGTCRYLLLIIPTKFLITLNACGSA